MSPLRHLPLPALAACAVVALAAAPAFPGTAATRISYLSGGGVYIDAGQLDGVQKGDTLEVVSGADVAARLLVTFTSSKRAACDTLWTRRALAVGDSVHYEARVVAQPNVAGGAGGTRGAGSRTSRPYMHGRLGGMWLAVDGIGGHFEQPEVDLRLDGTGSNAGHVDLSVDMRNRRTTRDFAGISSTEQLSRVYRATFTVRSLDSHERLTIGRQSSPTLASVSLFDGALLELAGERHSVGFFSGTQPDPLSMDFSREIVQAGGYAEWHQAALSQQRWTIATGGVASREQGVLNRDFLFAQSWWFSKGFNASLTQELDVNTGWKRALGEPLLSPSSTFGMARVPVTSWCALTTGIDNRRNVRLYRDRLTPETEFDDQYREGGWLGSEFSIANRVRLNVESRGSAGADRSHSWTASADLIRSLPLGAAAHLRFSHFYGAAVDSRLQSYGLGFDPLPRAHIESAGGVRSTSGGLLVSADVEHWYSVDFDFTLGRRWYANGSWEHDSGGSAGQTRQVQAGLSWGF